MHNLGHTQIYVSSNIFEYRHVFLAFLIREILETEGYKRGIKIAMRGLKRVVNNENT